MAHYLLQISIGPVQDFISAARRTRDLWFGSYLLSEISKTAAKAVKDAGGNLIFPNLAGLSPEEIDSEECNVANVILAETDSEECARNASLAARKAAETRWGEFTEEAFAILRGCVMKDAWDYQKSGVIEFYSAWSPFKEDLSDYREARKNVARLLAGRKNIRDFTPWRGKAGVPKSSLDGLRESVLKPRTGNEDLTVRGIRIKKGEALDLVGCVKRAAGQKADDEKRAFPSVTRIAADPWIRGLEKKRTNTEVSKNYENLCALCKSLAEKKVLSPYESVSFPYEGTALLPQRYSEFLEGFGGDAPNDIEAIKELRRELESVVTKLHRQHKPMEPYLAVLVADGDKMGAAISTLKTPDEHRKFSRKLSEFASIARDIVQKHFGCCVYTGGDDVLAFLPLDRALLCARELHDMFGNLWAVGWNFEKNPTLSVGLAVGHALEDLEFLLKWGREAEKLAKEKEKGKENERDGLGITIRARGNSEIFIREQWKEEKDTTGGGVSLQCLSLDQRLKFWAECFAKEAISSKFPYELRGSAKLYEERQQGEILGKAMKIDVLRIFGRKEVRLNGKEKERVAEYIENAIEGSYKSIERLADELLTAQWIGMALKAAGEV
ncbi:MAG: type III-B CRISPR-associated protein Cas10/Cmr2 [Synergistaceae bacterium]|jgi:CRISPR-associated protein Cmr2|nr:type III-B CRISPR-associated protein Cas10/Cmr2 [Synergistaceae bacterium]